MASEVVRTTWCDIHLKVNKKKVEGVEGRATALADGRVISIDLCDACYKELTWAQVLAFGTSEDAPKVDRSKMTEKLKAKAGPGKYQRTLVECGSCHQQYTKGPGWTHHAKWHERQGDGTPNQIPLAS